MKKFYFARGAFILILFLCNFSFVSAQNVVVKGRVKDSGGKILEAVNINTSTGQYSVSNQNGEFSLSLKPQKQTITFSRLGYQSVNVEWNNQKIPLNIVLIESSSRLEEVVVIGFDQVKRRELTGSIGSVNMEDLTKAPVGTFSEALGGRVAGLQVISSEGKPGSDIDIVIRGIGSITQNTGPLYVVDGMPLESPQNDGAGNPLSLIDPNDIASIDVLKDASATAIYGARGGNGVIMITTKRGQEALPRITYNGYYGLANATKRQEVLGPYDYVNLMWEMDSVRTKSMYLDGGNVTLEEYKNKPGVNWEDLMFEVAPTQKHQVGFSGGTKATKYSFTGSLFDQKGVIINSGFKRIQGRLTLDQQINPKLKIGMDASYNDYKTYGTSPSTGTYSHQLNLLYSVWAYRPIMGINYDIDDLLENGLDPELESSGSQDFRFNPVLSAKNQLRDNIGNSFSTNAYLDYTIIKGLKYKLSGSFNKGNRHFDSFNNSNTPTGHSGNNYKVNGSRSFYETNRWYVSNQLNYNKTVAKRHHLSAMAAFTAERSSNIAFGGTGVRLINESLGMSGIDEGEALSLSSSSSASSMASFMGRFMYNYRYKYFLTFTGRMDGTSRFLGDNVYGFFPSASAGWTLKKENFLSDINWISNAKVRASWGLTGNNGVGNFAAHNSLASSNTTGYGWGGTIVRGVVPTGLGNQALKWESSSQSNIGIDLGFFNERLTFVADVYRKESVDLLMNANLTLSTGYKNAYKNIGKIRNEGLEFTIGVVPIKGKFVWSSEFNISFNKNKVLELVDNQSSLMSFQPWGADWENVPAFVGKIGAPVSQFYGHVYDGLYTYDDFNVINGKYVLKATEASNGTSTLGPGHKKYVDINNDKIINDLDKVVIGNPLPKHFGGFSNNFQYKGLDLNVFFQWSYGNDIMNANRIIMESGTSYNVNQFATYLDRWSPENPDGKLPAIKGSLLKTYSTSEVEDGSFLRLKTVALGYTIPGNTVKILGLSRARVYMSAQNLYTWTNYSGYDPEVSVRNSALMRGFDYSAYPRARTYTFGLDLTF
jgi:TonB-linked SusC/RagA family outer membrane protein